MVETSGSGDQMMAPRFLRPEDVAKVLSITVSQVYTLMRSGQMPAVKIGKRGVWRVSTDALEVYIGELNASAAVRAVPVDATALSENS